MPPIIISDSEDDDRKPDLSPPRNPLLDPSLDREINELKTKLSKYKEERSELQSRLDKVDKRIEISRNQLFDLVEKKNATLNLVLSKGDLRTQRGIKRKVKPEVIKVVKKEDKGEMNKKNLSARVLDTRVTRGVMLKPRADVDNRVGTPVALQAVQTRRDGVDDDQPELGVPEDEDEDGQRGPGTPEKPDTWDSTISLPELVTTVLPDKPQPEARNTKVHTPSTLPRFGAKTRKHDVVEASKPRPQPTRESIIKEELSSDSENGVPRFTIARSEVPVGPAVAIRTSRRSTRGLSSVSQSPPPDSQLAESGISSSREASIEIYEKVQPWVIPTEDNDRIAASEDANRKFTANELIKMWPKLRIPNLPWPTIKFTRRFLSKVLGGGEQMVECVISAAKQRTQIYPIKVYYCERSEWSPDMPPEPGAHGVVYATTSDPKDPERPVDFNYSSYAVFCRRATNQWDYCGEYEITRRKFIPGEWDKISSIAKKSWSEGFSGKTGKKWGINTLMKRGLLNPGDPMPSPEDIIELIDQGRLPLECQIYRCVDYKRDFYNTLADAWSREIEIDQEIKREEDEEDEGDDGDVDMRLPVKRKRRLTTTRRVSKEYMETDDEEEAVVERQETRRKRRRRRRINDEKEDDEDDEDEDYTDN